MQLQVTPRDWKIFQARLDGEVLETVVPPAVGSPGSISASFSWGCTISGALFPQASSTPSWLLNGSIAFEGDEGDSLCYFLGSRRSVRQDFYAKKIQAAELLKAKRSWFNDDR